MLFFCNKIYFAKKERKKAIYVNARFGSGGVGFLLKDHILEYFSLIIADDAYEGIYWLKLTAKRSDFVLMICVLPTTHIYM